MLRDPLFRHRVASGAIRGRMSWSPKVGSAGYKDGIHPCSEAPLGSSAPGYPGQGTTSDILNGSSPASPLARLCPQRKHLPNDNDRPQVSAF